MEDDWIEFYSDRENLENYYEKYDKENHTSGFVKRKFYFSKNMEPDTLAFQELSDAEKKLIKN